MAENVERKKKKEGDKGKHQEKVRKNALKVVPTVKCEVCDETHDASGDSFLTIYGDVSIGADNLLGNTNFDEKGKIFSSVILCRSMECVLQYLQLHKDVVTGE